MSFIVNQSLKPCQFISKKKYSPNMSLRWTDGNRSCDLLVGRHFTSPLQQQVWLYCVRMVVDFKTRTTFDWKIQSMKVYTNESVHQISDWRFILSSVLSIKNKDNMHCCSNNDKLISSQMLFVLLQWSSNW